jgi:hypothetical protein
MGSSFFTKDGLVLPKPSQVARTKIRNLYTDGYPGREGSRRNGRYPKRQEIAICNNTSPWFSPGNRYSITGFTNCKDGDGKIIENAGDHEYNMIDYSRDHGGEHFLGSVTGLMDDICPDPTDRVPVGWSPEEDCD